MIFFICDTFLKTCLYTITVKYISTAVKMQKEKLLFLEKTVYFFIKVHFFSEELKKKNVDSLKN